MGRWLCGPLDGREVTTCSRFINSDVVAAVSITAPTALTSMSANAPDAKTGSRAWSSRFQAAPRQLAGTLASRIKSAQDRKMRRTVCPLCRDPGSLPIVSSHLMPAALYLKTREPGIKNSRLVLMTSKTTTPTDKQIEDHLLCRACEDLLNKNGEAYTLSKVHNGKDFPLFDRLKVAIPLYSAVGVEKYSGA